MLNLLLKDLKLVAKNSIRGYKRMSKNNLISLLKASKPIKRNKTTKNIRKKVLVLIKYLKA